MDGELPGVESLQIRNHLTMCSECASEYDDLLSMKRLVGRLKIQEPVSEIATEILQSIRIETDLLAERSPAARFREFTNSIRAAFATPSTLGLGFGVAAVAALLYSQSISGNEVHVVGEWDHTVPTTSEFTSGVRYPNSDRFISPVFRSGGSGSGVEAVSFGSGFQDLRQAPPQFGSTDGYFVRSH
jgi:hypothetical protein